MKENIFLPLHNDKVFIDIFGNKDNIKFSEYFLECFFGFENGYLNGKLKVAFETTIDRQCNDKTCRLDLVYYFDDVLVNLECYSTFDYSSLEKSLKYFTKLDDQVLVKLDSKINKIVQINLIYKSNIALPKEVFNEQINHPSNKILKMCLLRLDQLKNFDYTSDNKRKEDLLLFLKFINSKNKETREKIAKERKILMELNERIELYGNELGLNPEDFDYEKNTIEANYRVGYREGSKRGEKQGLLKTAKNLLAYGMPIEDISKNTSLSLKEIQSISLN